MADPGPDPMNGPQPADPGRELAALDLGSNSFHIVVARLFEGELTILDRLKEPVRLASGLGPNKQLAPEAQERAIECLRRFGQRVHHLPRGSIRAVGTNTLRSARNGRTFLLAAREALGHPIEIVSGIEEARLIYLGVSHSVESDDRRRLVIDIGGGSTELIIGRGFEPLDMNSLYMGCVSMTQQYFSDGAITKRAFRKATVAAHRELEPHRAHFAAQNWEVAVGASGTIRAVYDVASAEGFGADGITLEALYRVRDACIAAGQIGTLALVGLSADRAPVFPGGVAVLTAAFESLGIEQMSVSGGALREGLLYDLLGRLRDDDVRNRSVAALAARYHVDEPQATRIERTALACLAQVATAWELEDDEAKRMLAWAAQLHEIGLGIAYSHYHKHGAYIAENCDLAGFSTEGQRLLAALIRTHRRKLPSPSVDQLGEPAATRALRLAVLLRLAVSLHRSRSPDPLPPVTLRARKNTLEIAFPKGWMKQHPLTRADLEQEVAYLGSAGIKLRIK